MKKLLLGIALGASIVGCFATIATNNYIELIEKQNARITELGNEVAHLKFANKQLKVEVAKWTD